MAAKKKPPNALQAVLDRQATPSPAPATPLQSPRSAQKNLPARAGGDSANYQPPSRTGKRLIGGHFSPEVAKHLKILAAEEETSIQALLEEALSLLFVKKGKGHIGHA